MEIDYKGFCKALGIHIKQLRKARGWSNRDILMIHGVNDAQWRKYERGGGLTVESLLRVAAIFEMSIGAFLDGLKDYPVVELSDLKSRAAKSVAKAARKTAKKSTSKERAPYAKRV